MFVVFLKLLLAHIVGDFVLQTRTMVIKRKVNIGYLLLHIVLHAVVLTVLFSSELSLWWKNILFISATHLAIDSLKIWYEHHYKFKPIKTFLIDQLMHLFVLIGVVMYQFDQRFDPSVLMHPVVLVYMLGALMVLFVSPVLMQAFFSKWTTEISIIDKRRTL